MAVTLAYDSANARVSITASVLGSDATYALVERSEDVGTTYDQVRGGAEWDVTTSSFTSTLYDYEFASSQVNTYRVSPYDDANFSVATALNGLVLDGTSGDYASTPDAATLDIVGDLDLRFEGSARDWTPSGTQTLVGKWNSTGNQRSYKLLLLTDGTLQLYWSTDGTATLNATSTAAPTIPASGRLAVRVAIDVNDGGGNRVITFYTSASIGGAWTQLGSTVTTAGTTSIFSGTSTAFVGAASAGTEERFAGVIHAAQILSGIGGTVVANPDFTIQSNGATSFADTAAVPKTWTVNGAAELRVPQTSTVTPTLTSFWLKSLYRPYLNRSVRVIGFSEVIRRGRGGTFDIKGRTLPIAVTEVRSSRSFTLSVRETTRTDAEDLDLVLASGDVMLLHSSGADDHAWLPSKVYISIGDVTGPTRFFKDSTVADFTIPCTEVAQPDIDIYGATTTWASIMASYASWTALMTAWADWSAVLDSDTGSVVIVP